MTADAFEPIANIAARVLTDLSGRVRREIECERPHGCKIGAGGVQCGGVPVKFSGDDTKSLFRLIKRHGPDTPAHAMGRKNDHERALRAVEDLPIAAG